MPEEENKVFEEKLLKSVLKAHSVFIFLTSFLIDLATYGAIFWIGYHKDSSIWILPLLFVLALKDLWILHIERKKFIKVIKTLRNEEKQLVLADLNQLPPWVHFPDVDRCDWFNKLLSHFWPHVCTFIENMVKKEVEPIVSGYLSGFKLQKVSLGSVPPFISGIKVYEKHVSSNRLIIDATLCYSGDSDFRFSYRGVPGGIKNLQLRGPARITLKILTSPPFIGGIAYSFLGKPEIDFILTGVGSFGFTEELTRKVINDQVFSRLVFPRKMSVLWEDRIQDHMPDSEGVIRINVIEANDLENKDGCLSRGKSDPYAEVSYGMKAFRSRVVEDCSDPKWDLWCEFVSPKNCNEPINIKIFDKDKRTMDDFIGSCSLKTNDIKKSGKLDSWRRLEKSKGSVHVRAYFIQISPDVQSVIFPPTELSFLSSYILEISVESAHNIEDPRSPLRPSCVVRLTVGNDTQTTQTIFNNDNPVFGEGFTFLVNNPEFNTLRARVIDENAKSDLGYFSYRLKKLLDRKGMEIANQQFPLIHSASDSSILLSMRLKVVQNESFQSLLG